MNYSDSPVSPVSPLFNPSISHSLSDAIQETEILTHHHTHEHTIDSPAKDTDYAQAQMRAMTQKHKEEIEELSLANAELMRTSLRLNSGARNLKKVNGRVNVNGKTAGI